MTWTSSQASSRCPQMLARSWSAWTPYMLFCMRVGRELVLGGASVEDWGALSYADAALAAPWSAHASHVDVQLPVTLTVSAAFPSTTARSIAEAWRLSSKLLDFGPLCRAAATASSTFPMGTCGRPAPRP